jgi:hypothetical protein
LGPHNVLKEKRISDKSSSTLHSTGQYCKKIKGELCCCAKSKDIAVAVKNKGK